MDKKTKLLKAEIEKDILEAASMIKNGQIVAIPTETVYGLAADARNSDAVEKIFTIKNRPSNHPLIVHIGSFEKVSEWAQDVPPIAAVIAHHFWPGPLTLLLKKHDSVNEAITGGLKTVALRVPDNTAVLKMLHLLDTGLAAPSANPHKRISPTTAQHVLSGLSGKIDAILDDGPCGIGVESTIVDLTQNNIRILRHGPITKQMLEAVLNISIDLPAKHKEHVPGNMKCHYQPYTKSSLMTLPAIEAHLCDSNNQEKLFGIIHYSDLSSVYKNAKALQLSKNKSGYSQFIYHALHEMDSINADHILIETPPHTDEWQDILDRLSKACAINNE